MLRKKFNWYLDVFDRILVAVRSTVLVVSSFELPPQWCELCLDIFCAVKNPRLCAYVTVISLGIFRIYLWSITQIASAPGVYTGFLLPYAKFWDSFPRNTVHISLVTGPLASFLIIGCCLTRDWVHYRCTKSSISVCITHTYLYHGRKRYYILRICKASICVLDCHNTPWRLQH